MTGDDDKKPEGVYRESPPDAPPPHPVSPTEYERKLQAEREAGTTARRSNSGCGKVFTIFVVVILVLVGLVFFTCGGKC